MIKKQNLSAAPGVRMPTLAEAMLDSLMMPSAATRALTGSALVVFGSLLLAVSAQFKIPLYPVPVTGQTHELLSRRVKWSQCPKHLFCPQQLLQ